MDQTIFNWAAAGMGSLLGFLLTRIWQSVDDLRKADAAMADKVAAIEVLVAGAYVKREELKADCRMIVEHLNRIEDKLDKKADKE